MKTTTTFKAMMAMAFATIAMTANAATAPKGNTWRDATPNIRIEVRHDNRHHRHYEIIPPRPMAPVVNHHGGAPTPPAPNHKDNHRR